jgi:hypothetical protein
VEDINGMFRFDVRQVRVLAPTSISDEEGVALVDKVGEAVDFTVKSLRDLLRAIDPRLELEVRG